MKTDLFIYLKGYYTHIIYFFKTSAISLLGVSSQTEYQPSDYTTELECAHVLVNDNGHKGLYLL